MTIHLLRITYISDSTRDVFSELMKNYNGEKIKPNMDGKLRRAPHVQIKMLLARQLKDHVQKHYVSDKLITKLIRV